ncbi:MAG: PEP-CTERM system histidine kinase PrsK [Desulfovibrionales bacterium]|nr:MAG: PEP-CTERM system histidine kinase PrsK [Desulfovibrionales bacterium]
MYLPLISILAIFLALGMPLLLMARRHRGLDMVLLLCALLTTAGLELCDLLALHDPAGLERYRRWGMLTESLLPATWLGFSLTFARAQGVRGISRLQLVLLALSCAFPVWAGLASFEAFYFSPDFAEERLLFLTRQAVFFYTGLLLFLVLPLVHLETTLVASAHDQRWKIKLALIGAGVILVGLLVYFSQGLLYRTINLQLVPLRSTALLLGVALMGYSLAIRGADTRINLSRQMALKSVVLLVVGIYLLGLGLLGEGMKHFGPDFPKVLLAIIALISGAALLVVLLSASLKRKILVFLTKHFYENKYDYRLEWKKFTEHLSRAKTREDLEAAVLAGFCETFGMGSAALFLRDYESNVFQSRATLAMAGKPGTVAADDPLLRPMTHSDWICNLRQDSWASDTPEIIELFRKNRIVLLAPLNLNERLDGFIALGAPLDKGEVYTFEDYDLIKAMCRQVALALMNLRLADQLAQAREMEAVGKVSAFVAHDLKNLVYTLSLMLDNAREYMADPEFQDDMLVSLENTVKRMNVLISRLKTLPSSISLHLHPLDLADLARETAASLAAAPVRLEGRESLWVLGDREELRKVVLNLLLNALEAQGAAKTPHPITVAIIQDGEEAALHVRDQAGGIDPALLHDGLFTPFKTTKPKGLGIGLYQCKQIVTAHGGRIEVRNTPGVGAEFIVRLAVHHSSDGDENPV